ncbi:MAG TPA: Kdo hydroxylase family protein [Chlamydiales bacterium]|nr:Kdo hydroxylase family protein [Chlamydiales bacterium]
MTKKILVEDIHDSVLHCRDLEQGNILFFEKIPFDFPQAEIEFLLQQRQSGSTTRKNIAYKPQVDKITNHVAANDEEAKRMHDILRSYSSRVTTFLKTLLAPYSAHWKLDYASFRPYQEMGRKLRTRARNDLLHVDSFPTRPMHGGRILRFFTNINQQEPRRWITSEPFQELIKKFGGKKGLPFPKGVDDSLQGRFAHMTKGWLKSLGFKIPMRSPYDRFMLNMHNYLKENEAFQKGCPKSNWEFPPNSCWAVFTDQVSHAAISGQYALEQTLFIPRDALLHPEKSPVSILERMTGRPMVLNI